MNAAPLSAAARRARRLGLLGGSFDPPHLGHLHVARVARDARELDHVVFVPAARPPHKPGRRLASGEERLEMLALLLEDVPWASIWDVELRRAGPSFTVTTLETLALEAPQAELFLLLGRDNLADLPGWHRVEDVLHLAHPLVVARTGSDWDAPRLGGLSPAARRRVEEGRLEAPPLEVSSTDLRAADEHEPRALPPKLRDWVRRRGLYRERG